jgi:hypothetical protein
MTPWVPTPPIRWSPAALVDGALDCALRKSLGGRGAGRVSGWTSASRRRGRANGVLAAG